MFDTIEMLNRIYGMRTALREADALKLDVRYNPHTFMLECFIGGELMKSFKAN